LPDRLIAAVVVVVAVVFANSIVVSALCPFLKQPQAKPTNLPAHSFAQGS